MKVYGDEGHFNRPYQRVARRSNENSAASQRSGGVQGCSTLYTTERIG